MWLSLQYIEYSSNLPFCRGHEEFGPNLCILQTDQFLKVALMIKWHFGFGSGAKKRISKKKKKAGQVVLDIPPFCVSFPKFLPNTLQSSDQNVCVKVVLET